MELFIFKHYHFYQIYNHNMCTKQVYFLVMSLMPQMLVNYVWVGRSQRKLWWRSTAVVVYKLVIWPGYRCERLIEPSSELVSSEFPSGQLALFFSGKSEWLDVWGWNLCPSLIKPVLFVFFFFPFNIYLFKCRLPQRKRSSAYQFTPQMAITGQANASSSILIFYMSDRGSHIWAISAASQEHQIMDPKWGIRT